MSSATATAPGTYKDLRAFLASRKEASLKDPPSADSVIPGDKGTPPETGARFSENSSDTKNMPPGYNAEHGPDNPRTGEGVPVPNGNLEQTTADEGDSQTRAISKVHGENEKMSGLDPTRDADLTRMMAHLAQAAAALPGMVAASGAKAAAARPGPRAAQPSAAQQAVLNTVEAYRKMGSDRGRVVAAYLQGFDQTYAFLKQALDEGSLAQMLQGGGGGAQAGAPGPADPGAGAPGAGAPDPAAVAAMMGGAGGGAPGGAPGGDPGAGADPSQGGDPGAGGGGGMSDDDLAAAFEEAGITPEEFVHMLMQMKGKMDGDGGAGAGGGAPPDMPPEEKEKAAMAIRDGIKIASHVADYKKSGRFRFKPAADGSPSRRGRDQIKQYILELRGAAA